MWSTVFPGHCCGVSTTSAGVKDSSFWWKPGLFKRECRYWADSNVIIILLSTQFNRNGRLTLSTGNIGEQYLVWLPVETTSLLSFLKGSRGAAAKVSTRTGMRRVLLCSYTVAVVCVEDVSPLVKFSWKSSFFKTTATVQPIVFLSTRRYVKLASLLRARHNVLAGHRLQRHYVSPSRLYARWQLNSL